MLRASRWKGKPKHPKFEDLIECEIMPHDAAQTKWIRKLNELKKDVKEWENPHPEDTPEHDAHSEMQQVLMARAAVGTILLDFKDFIMPAEVEGEPDITVSFDAPSTDLPDVYENQADQLMAEDPLFRKFVMDFSYDNGNFNDLKERELVKKS